MDKSRVNDKNKTEIARNNIRYIFLQSSTGGTNYSRLTRLAARSVRLTQFVQRWQNNSFKKLGREGATNKDERSKQAK